MITKALLLKGLAGGAVLVSAAAVGWNWESIFGSRSREIELTKWDDALIKAIDKTGNTINFTLSSGANNSSLTEFPSFADTSGQNPATTQEASITFTVTASDQTYNDTDKLKKLNQPNTGAAGEGTAWTWECTVKFIRNKANGTTQAEMEDEDKKKIFKGNSEGLLWKISQNNNEEEKKKVIRLCAKERKENKTLETSKGLTDKSNKISSTVVFTSTVEQNNLVFKEKKFEEWFN